MRQPAGFNYVRCDRCNKYAYLSKKEAKRAKRILHPGTHLDVYECPHMSGTFHIAHMPYHVRNRGIADRHGNFKRRRDLNEPGKITPLSMPQKMPQKMPAQRGPTVAS